MGLTDDNDINDLNELASLPNVERCHTFAISERAVLSCIPHELSII
jgi:hypothetical protein